MMFRKERPHMQPIGALMIEHRLIERMLRLMQEELDRIGKYGRVDSDFIDDAVDFMRTFTDISHHGKEEQILFPALGTKSLAPQLRQTMEELIQEHKFARETVERIEAAKESYLRGERNAPSDIISSVNIIIEFYPHHIDKEDRHFFLPAMGYFSDVEKRKMLDEFTDFDSRLIAEKYRGLVDSYEGRYHTKSGQK